MKILLDDGAIMPTRAHETDAGLDLYSMETITIQPRLYSPELGIIPSPIQSYYTFDTGVHVAFDHGTYGKIESKSGLNVYSNIVSCGGVIDEGYTGSIKVKLYNLGYSPCTINKGDKIAQFVIMPYLTPEIELVDRLDETDRGNNGFGSTGK